MSAQKPEDLIFNLDNIEEKLKNEPPFDKTKHDTESRFKITKLYLNSYFSLIAGTFIFAAAYNFYAAHINQYIPNNPIDYIGVIGTVTIIISSLGNGMGFVLGYYFKNGGE